MFIAESSKIQLRKISANYTHHSYFPIDAEQYDIQVGASSQNRLWSKKYSIAVPSMWKNTKENKGEYKEKLRLFFVSNLKGGDKESIGIIQMIEKMVAGKYDI